MYIFKVFDCAPYIYSHIFSACFYPVGGGSNLFFLIYTANIIEGFISTKYIWLKKLKTNNFFSVIFLTIFVTLLI